MDYYGYTSLTGLKEDLKEIGVPKIVFTFANSWTFGNLMGYEDFGSAFFRKNISEMTEEEREEKDPYYYLEKNRTELAARLSAYLIHGDSDMTIPLPSSVRLQRALAELERSGLVNSQRTAGRFITQDAEALTRLRRSMSEQIISELFARLRALGMSDAQILEAVRQRTVRPLNDRLEC